MSFIKNIISILENHKQLISKQKIQTVPSHYAEIQQAAIELELDNEVLKLHDLFINNTEASIEYLQNQFRELCEQRDKDIQNTCLSYTAIPEGACNQLYFEIANILFKPKQLDEIVSLLMPSITQSLAIEISDKLAPQSIVLFRQEDRVQITLNPKPLNTLAKYAPKLSELTQAITGDNIILMLEGIKQFPLFIHKQINKLMETYPITKDKLYQHNDDFKQLAFDIELINKNGITSYERLTNFAYELTRSGARYSGSTYATNSATYACLQFHVYLDQLPEILRTELLALQPSTRNDSLANVMEHLEKGECVEVAARRIKLIQENQHNKIILNKRPSLSEEQLKKVKRKYLKPIAIIGYETTKRLPASVLEPILKNIKITSASDYIDLFINLPASEYIHFLTHADITCQPALPLELGAVLDMLDTEQKSAFLGTLITLKKKFGGINEVVKFCIANKITAIFSDALKLLSQKKIEGFVKNDHLSTASLFHQIISSNSLEIFQSLWAILTEKQRLIFLNEIENNGVNSLHLAAMNVHPDVFITLWNCSPEIAALLLPSKITPGMNFLHYLAQNTNPETFIIIWKMIPKHILTSLIDMKDDKGKTPLRYAALNSNPIIFKTIWDFLPEQSRLNELIFCSSEGDNLLHVAAKNSCPEIYLMIWNWDHFPEQNRLELINKVNDENNTPMHQLACNSHPAVLIGVWNNLAELYRSITMQIKNSYNRTVWHSAFANRSASIKEVWNTLSEQDQFAILLEKNYEGNNVFTWAIINDSFDILEHVCERLSLENLKILFHDKNFNGSTPLHQIIEKRNIKMLNIIIKKFVQISDFIFTEDNDGLHSLAIAMKFQTNDIAKILWNHLSPHQKQLAISDKEILYLAIKTNPETFLMLWESLADHDKLKAINSKNLMGKTILQTATQNGHFITWKKIWDYHKEKKYDLIHEINKKQVDTLYTLLRLAIYNKDFQIFDTLLNHLPSHDRFNAIKARDHHNTSVLRSACLYNVVKHFSLMWNSLSPQEQLAEVNNNILHFCILNSSIDILGVILQSQQNKLLIIQKKDPQGMSALQLTLRHGLTGKFNILWESLSIEERSTVLNVDNLKLLHQAIDSATVESFHSLWQNFSSQEQLIIINNNKNAYLLHEAIKRGHIQVFFSFWKSLSPSDKLAAIEMHDYSFLYYALEHSHAKIFHAMWSIMSPQDRFSLLTKKDENGNLLFTLLIQRENLNAFNIIWNSLYDSEKMILINQKDAKDITALHWAIQCGLDEFFFSFWQCLSDEDQLRFHQEKTIEGSGLLHFAAQKSCPKIWEFIWNLYSKETCLIKIQEKGKDDKNPLHFAMETYNRKAICSILKLLPEENHFSALIEKDTTGKSSLDYALRDYSFFKFVLEQLSQIDQAKVINLLSDKSTKVISVNPFDINTFNIWLMLLKSQPSETVLDIALGTKSKGSNIFEHLVYHGRHDLLIDLLELLSKQNRFLDIYSKNLNGDSVVHIAIKENKPASLFALLKPLANNNDKMKIFSEKNRNGDAPLHILARSDNIKSMQVILNSIPEPDRLTLLLDMNELGNTPLHLAAQNSNPQIWFTMMECLSKSSQLIAAATMSSCGYTPLQKSAENNDPKILLGILNLYSKTEQLEIIDRLVSEWQRNRLIDTHLKMLTEKREELLLEISESPKAIDLNSNPHKASKLGLFSHQEISKSIREMSTLQSSLVEGFVV